MTISARLLSSVSVSITIYVKSRDSQVDNDSNIRLLLSTQRVQRSCTNRLVVLISRILSPFHLHAGHDREMLGDRYGDSAMII